MQQEKTMQEQITLNFSTLEPRQNYHRFRDLDITKLRGGYYTPIDVADWMSRWAIRSSHDQILEPSCGDGVFVLSAAKILSRLGCSTHDIETSITAVELVSGEAEKARKSLHQLLRGKNQTIINSDFFEYFISKNLAVDVVIGNPPYIRYQSFPEENRKIAMNIMGKHGLKPNKLTNIWVPFVVASAVALRPGGRMAMVLPAELMQVTYAAQLRDFLIRKFEKITIVTCNELIFPNAEQEVVLLLAEGAGDFDPDQHKCAVSIVDKSKINEVLAIPFERVGYLAEQKKVSHAEEKWLKFFLSSSEIDLMRELRLSERTTTLASYAKVNVGVVTGKNDFFVLSHQMVNQKQFKEFVIPIISRSAHLSGAILSAFDWHIFQQKAKAKVCLLYLNEYTEAQLPAQMIEYLRWGESQHINSGYKCSIRNPWYSIPSVSFPQGFLFRQIYDFPRIVKNDIGATSTDTIHRVTTDYPIQKLFPNVYTYLTGASAEIEGRSYGGGVLELEPKEASRLLMPAQLQTGMSLEEIDINIRKGKLEDILETNTRQILHDGMGMSMTDCNMLKGIWQKMRGRRFARKQKDKI